MDKTEKLIREMCQMPREKLIANVLPLTELKPEDAVRYEMQFGARINLHLPHGTGPLE